MMGSVSVVTELAVQALRVVLGIVAHILALRGTDVTSPSPIVANLPHVNSVALLVDEIEWHHDFVEIAEVLVNVYDGLAHLVHLNLDVRLPLEPSGLRALLVSLAKQRAIR
jgi:hypothetical protein